MLNIKLFILCFIPESLFASFLGLAFFGIRLKWPKLLTVGLTVALANYLLKSLIVHYNLGGLYIIIFLIDLYLAYRFLVLVKPGVAAASSLSIIIFMYAFKFILLNPVLAFFHTTYNQLSDNLWLEIKVSNGVDLILFITGIIAYLTKFKIADFSNSTFPYKGDNLLRNKVENKALFIVNILLVNLLLTGLLIIYHYFGEKKINYFRALSFTHVYIMFGIFSMVILAGTVGLIVVVLKQLKNIHYTEVEEANILANKQMVEFLDKEKDDFHHHLSSILELIKAGQREKLTHYLKQVSSEITTIGNLNILEKQELKALFMQKSAEAKKFNISAQYNINSPLHRLAVSSTDLVRIIGNLFDNAIEALGRTGYGQKEILLNIYETRNKVVIEVFNNEPVIPWDMQMKIFQKGVTSKTKEGHGYGLAIVKEIVERYQGTISLRSVENEGTLFTIEFPYSDHNKAVS